MKTRIIQRDSELPIRLIELIAAVPVATDKQEQYSNAVEYALIEMIRLRMRRLALDRKSRFQRGELLSAALDSVRATVTDAMQRRQLKLDLTLYLKQAKKQLKSAAKELETLSSSLQQSRQEGKIAPREEHIVDSGRAYEIRKLGLSGNEDGLLVLPREQSTEIDIDKLRSREDCFVSGEWFPYEIQAGGFVFVIDDDGSIFVSIENLPERVVGEAHSLITQIADTLYD